MQDETLEIVTDELQKIARRSATVTPQSSITRDLGLDSLAVMDTVMALEERFDVMIPLDRIAEVDTVEDLVAVIGILRTGKAA